MSKNFKDMEMLKIVNFDYTIVPLLNNCTLRTYSKL